MTDASTRPGYPGRSYRTPSGTHQNEWSVGGSFFYVTSTDGTVIPFAFDAVTGTASRLQPASSGDGGMILQFYIEPQFSAVTDSQIYGGYSGRAEAGERSISTISPRACTPSSPISTRSSPASTARTSGASRRAPAPSSES